jgi:hypothetical protein
MARCGSGRKHFASRAHDTSRADQSSASATCAKPAEHIPPGDAWSEAQRCQTPRRLVVLSPAINTVKELATRDMTRYARHRVIGYE